MRCRDAPLADSFLGPIGLDIDGLAELLAGVKVEIAAHSPRWRPTARLRLHLAIASHQLSRMDMPSVQRLRRLRVMIPDGSCFISLLGQDVAGLGSTWLLNLKSSARRCGNPQTRGSVADSAGDRNS